MKKFVMKWWMIVVVLVGLTYYAVPVPSRQFYLIVLENNTSFVGKVYGSTHFWSPIKDAYIIRNIYYVRPVDARDASKGAKILDHGEDIYWPWEMLIEQSQIRSFEPINKNSPLGSAIEQADKRNR